MSIIRTVKTEERPYTRIDNESIRDSRISFKARGLHHFLVSHPDKWEINTKHLVSHSDRDGRDSIYSALAELEEFGYIVRRRIYNSLGRIEWETEVHEIPQTNDETIEKSKTTSGKSRHGSCGGGKRVSSTSGKPVSGKSALDLTTSGFSVSGETVSGKSGPLLTNEESTNDQETNDPDPILSVQQAETDLAATNGKKGKGKGKEKTKGVNNRNKADIYAKLKNPEGFESFWDWYNIRLDSIPPDRNGRRVKPGSKNLAAEAWKTHIEDANKLDLFREGCRKFDFVGTLGVPHANRFIKDEFYLNGISNGSGADFAPLSSSSAPASAPATAIPEWQPPSIEENMAAIARAKAEAAAAKAALGAQYATSN